MTDQHEQDTEPNDESAERATEPRTYDLGTPWTKAATSVNPSVTGNIRWTKAAAALSAPGNDVTAALQALANPGISAQVRSALESYNTSTKMIAASVATVVESAALWQKTVAIPTARILKFYDLSGVDLQLRPMLDQVAGALSGLGELLQDHQRQQLVEGGPANWTELHETHDVLDLLDVVGEHGIPVTWVPRASILAELIDAEPAERDNVLNSRRNDILDDCDRVLYGLKKGFSDEQVCLLQQAIHVLRLGQFGPAQALATLIFDTTLRATVLPPTKHGYYAKVKDKINDMSFLTALAVTYWPVLAALDQFNGQTDEPTPSRFNRHATVHQADLIQFTEVNALIVVMLATSMLREAQFTEDQQESNPAEPDCKDKP
ncbi:hypothetical protein [Amycolatopsis keratiniphila]|uniref:Uncharacterized protein n=1 Tax=Amycolatopsis keratiniphila subsp. keratiniphila TaxID=227715 RepID=A0A1W2LYT3_9PSEU|nr:hypothetical protein [Amycolatopsis keratiniphila]ONF72342.1 hypothetical protein AVR91_0208985 [Amycolatopsis keratiniphila subsp. keratiniphila]